MIAHGSFMGPHCKHEHRDVTKAQSTINSWVSQGRALEGLLSQEVDRKNRQGHLIADASIAL